MLVKQNITTCYSLNLYMYKQRENIKLNFEKPEVCNVKVENALGIGIFIIRQIKLRRVHSHIH